MKMQAAVLWERGQPLSIEDVELDPPGAGEVLVEIKAAGVCHSDLHPARDDWPTRTPIVLGHEGAGIVREVGSAVSRIKAGDHVVFCWAPACGVCPSCAEGRAVLCDRLDRTTYRNRLPSGAVKLHARGQDLNHFLSTACFAQFAVVAQEGAVVVPADVSFEALATLGCAVVTGVGAVMTAARVPAGTTIAVIGAGGVGLNILQGAQLAGCERIIAIDRQPAPLGLAKVFGATDTIGPAAGPESNPGSKPGLGTESNPGSNTGLGTESNPSSNTESNPGSNTGSGTESNSESEDTGQKVRSMTRGRGADFVFDTVGSRATLTLALDLARKGGTVVVTGLSRIDAVGGVALFPFVMQDKRLVGSVYGSGRPTEDIVRLVEWYRQGRLKLRELVSRTYTLNQIDDALNALAGSAGARGVILQ